MSKKTDRPLALKEKAVPRVAAAYREVESHPNVVERVRRALGQAKRGLSRSVDEVFHDLARER